ncbi:protein trichome birefringence-like 41 [Ipomoea triloba]|uniref:protein trichome birefringence-like 41 n=1 Tax=Ipomoea triloba TaxID=35885 RepID=UPI00125DE535|nr:protein trichome birefringence-like 41 [Ipomoea triloba]
MRKGVCSLVGAAIFMVSACFLSEAHDDKRTRMSHSCCNMFEGSWVYDDSYPLYNSAACPFIRDDFNCVKYGRTNLQYLKYRWQPNDCDLPRFDGRDFLRRFKGKTIMFIGDSISLNFYESLKCLLNAAVSGESKSKVETRKTHHNYLKDYGVEVKMFHTNFLVDIERKDIGRVLKLHSLKNGDVWKQADVLIFNTWQWWGRRGQGQPWDYIEHDGKVVKDMNRVAAFSAALDTWAKWVETEVNHTKTHVIYQGVTPSHYKGAEWGEPGVRNCLKETRPIKGSTYAVGLPVGEKIVKQAQNRMTKPFYLLDITRLSELRKDGHPAIYSGLNTMDCTHWCLAGVPDTWAQILYAHLVSGIGN